jgi:hypothetical protein
MVDDDRTLEKQPDLAPVADCGPHEFPYRDRNGTEPSYTCKVPASTHHIYMVAGGGCGGYGSDFVHPSGGPGGGGTIEGLVPVISGEILNIFVGQGAVHGRHPMPGYISGGAGGTAPAPFAANGGAGGGSSAVVGSKSGLLIHAAGGGGAGGTGESAGGGDGGGGGRTPGNGEKGNGTILGPGGRGGQGGDPKMTARGGDGGSVDNNVSTSGGGGGGGGGVCSGDGGGAGQTGAGGGGGGGGSSFIVPTAIGIKESHTKDGFVTFLSASNVHSTIASAVFPNVYLRMDPHDVTKDSPIGGTVNCQFSAGELERFNVHSLAKGSIAFESVAAPGVYLRMDGSDVKQVTEMGGGVVNCQFGTGELTEFKIVAQQNGALAIESSKYPGVFLRLDGRDVQHFMDSGGGIVNCQFGARGWETFGLFAPAG